MLGEGGATTIEVKVGLTKNPRQLATRASTPTNAKAPISRRFCFLEDMVVGTPGTPGLYFRIVRIKNCSREELFPSALGRSRPSRQLRIVGSSLERPRETGLQEFPS